MQYVHSTFRMFNELINHNKYETNARNDPLLLLGSHPHHGVGLARPSLPVRKYTHIVAAEGLMSGSEGLMTGSEGLMSVSEGLMSGWKWVRG